MADISKIKLNNTEYNIKDSTARGVADTAIQSVKVNGTALTPDSNKAVDITAIPASIVSAGTLANGMTATTQTTSDDSAKVATTEFVHDVVDLLPSPMVFKGSLGTGGTITTLPTASSSNKGYVYKVITAGTYASQSAKVGDTFISDGSVWVLIPSGDEPSGTVTNVAVANGGGLTVSGSPITTSGTITVGHSNSVTAKTSSSLKKFTYDANGHVTDSSELSTAESDALASGINSTKVAQIETNKNNILSAQNQINYNTNTGVKNLLKENTVTFTGTSRDIAATPMKGEMVISLASAVSSDTDASTCTIIIYATDDSTIATKSLSRGVAWNSTFSTGEKTLGKITVYSSDNYVHGSGDTATYTDMMICLKSIYNKDSSYQPYAMSNAEITAWIQAHT